MPEYVEIEDTNEIRRLNQNLSTKLRRELSDVETRTIGYPQGHFQSEVHFFPSTGSGVFYWGGYLSKDKLTAHNYFGHGAPDTRETLFIDVQFNLPVARFSRRTEGAFLRNISTKGVILAHRGIGTIGHGRVKRADLFDRMFATPLRADTSAGTNEFLFIGELDSPTMIDEIDVFSSEFRRAARAIKAEATKAAAAQKPAPRRVSITLSDKLRDYFDEFSGERMTGGQGSSLAHCHHGAVVRAIGDAFKDATDILKSQAIDLTVILGKNAYLFEVKTSSDSQSVYTALGQLSAHAPVVAEFAPHKTVVKVMVLPGPPRPRLCNILKDKLGIRLLTFSRSSLGHITIEDIEQLS